MSDIPDRVRAILTESLCPAEPIEDGNSLVDDLGADSLDFVEIEFAIEDEFDIEVRVGFDARMIVKDVIGIVDDLVAAKG